MQMKIISLSFSLSPSRSLTDCDGALCDQLGEVYLLLLVRLGVEDPRGAPLDVELCVVGCCCVLLLCVGDVVVWVVVVCGGWKRRMGTGQRRKGYVCGGMRRARREGWADDGGGSRLLRPAAAAAVAGDRCLRRLLLLVALRGAARQIRRLVRRGPDRGRPALLLASAAAANQGPLAVTAGTAGAAPFAAFPWHSSLYWCY